MADFEFKKKFTLEERKKESELVRKKHSDHIPIIVEIKKPTNLPSLDRNKFLVSKDISIADFILSIRHRLALKPTESIFLMSNKNTLAGTQVLSSIYTENADEDGFLYISLYGETAFGN